jgi:hypothetical protein
VDHLFGAFLDTIQLVLPVALESGGPFVEGANGIGVGAVELLTALAAHPDEAYVAEDLEVLGDGGLGYSDGGDDVVDRVLIGGEEDEDLATAGFGYGVEGVGGGGGTGHGKDITFPYRNMSSGFLRVLSFG